MLKRSNSRGRYVWGTRPEVCRPRACITSSGKRKASLSAWVIWGQGEGVCSHRTWACIQQTRATQKHPHPQQNHLKAIHIPGTHTQEKRKKNLANPTHPQRDPPQKRRRRTRRAVAIQTRKNGTRRYKIQLQHKPL